MYYPVCGMVHIKEPLLLIGKSSPCGGSGFPLSLSDWSFTICLTPYNRGAMGRRIVEFAILSVMVHIKEPLLLIGKSSLCGGSGFRFLLS